MPTGRFANLPHSKASDNPRLSNGRRIPTLHRIFQQERGMRESIELPLRAIADVAFGSKPEVAVGSGYFPSNSEVAAGPRLVRSSPNRRHSLKRSAGPACANIDTRQ
jgi:hypothetical protein